jgi:DNA-binding CsgD family transcriptional regulator
VKAFVVKSSDEMVMHIDHICGYSNGGQCVLHENTGYANNLNKALDSAYSVLGVGLVFFDGNKNVAHVNVHAKARLKLPEDFIELGGDLIKKCFTKSEQVELKTSIDQLYANKIEGEVFINVMVKDEACVIMLERLEQTAFEMDVPGIAMFIFESKRNIEVSTSGVARIFGLTKAEARLTVGIVNGMTAAEYSAANGTSIHTTYSQIKGILSKTGVRRQAELVRLVLEHSPSFRRLDRHQFKDATSD